MSALYDALEKAEDDLNGLKRRLEPFFLTQGDALETVTDILMDIRAVWSLT